MTFALRKHVPGRADINRAFNRHHLEDTKRLFVDLKSTGSGYHFGDLSAKFCHLSDTERKAWDQEIGAFYPPDVQYEIVRTIEAALLGHKHPIPVRWDWVSGDTCGASMGVRVTYNAAVPHYHLEIIGYPSPAASALERRRKNQTLTPDDDIEA